MSWSFYSSDQANPFAEDDEEADESGQRDVLQPQDPVRPAEAIPEVSSGLKRPRDDEDDIVTTTGAQHAYSEPPGTITAPESKGEDETGPSPPPRSGYAFDDDAGEADETNREDQEQEGDEEAEENGCDDVAQNASAEPEEGATTGAQEENAGDSDPVHVPDNIGEDGGENRDGDEDEEGGEDEEDDSETLHGVTLRLSELEATDRTANERYSFELRMAVAQADTLRRYIRAQQDILEAAETAAAEAQHASAQTTAGSDAHLLPLTLSKAKAAIGRDPQVAAAVHRVARANARLRRLERRVNALRTLLASSGNAAATSEATAVMKTRTALEAQLYGSGAAPVGAPSLPSFADFLRTAPTNEALPSNAAQEMAESAAVLKHLLQALPLVQRPEKRDAVKRLLVGLGHLSRHNHQLQRYRGYLAACTEQAVAQREQAILTAEEWGLMAAQATYNGYMDHLSSAAAMREAHVARQNAVLRKRLQSLQSALATLVLSRVSPTAAGKSGASPDSIPYTRKAEVDKEVSRLTALREALVREVTFLRKEARTGAYGQRGLIGHRFDLILDAETHREPSETSKKANNASTADVLLTRQLMANAHAKLRDVMAKMLQDSTPHTASETPSTSEDKDRAEEQSEELVSGDSEGSLRMRVMEREEKMASHHVQMATLVAANARLSQEIQSVSHIAEFASEPDKASQLASLLLMKLGFPNASSTADAGEDGEEGAEPTLDTSLSAIEKHILGIFHEQTDALLEKVNQHLSLVSRTWAEQEQVNRTHAAFLARMVALKDLRDLTNASPSSDMSSLATPLAEIAAELEDPIFPIKADDDDEDVLAAPIPLLPCDNHEIEEEFASMLEEKFAAATPRWAKAQASCRAVREELDWYGQFDVEAVPQLLATSQEKKKALLQRTLEAGKRFKQSNDEKQQAVAVNVELKGLEEEKLPPLRERIAALTSTLQQLQETYATKKAESDLAKEAAEAERQLLEQRQREEQEEVERQLRAQEDVEGGGPEEDVQGQESEAQEEALLQDGHRSGEGGDQPNDLEDATLEEEEEADLTREQQRENHQEAPEEMQDICNEEEEEEEARAVSQESNARENEDSRDVFEDPGALQEEGEAMGSGESSPGERHPTLAQDSSVAPDIEAPPEEEEEEEAQETHEEDPASHFSANGIPEPTLPSDGEKKDEQEDVDVAPEHDNVQPETEEQDEGVPQDSIQDHDIGNDDTQEAQETSVDLPSGCSATIEGAPAEEPDPLTSEAPPHEIHGTGEQGASAEEDAAVAAESASEQQEEASLRADRVGENAFLLGQHDGMPEAGDNGPEEEPAELPVSGEALNEGVDPPAMEEREPEPQPAHSLTPVLHPSSLPLPLKEEDPFYSGFGFDEEDEA